MSNELKAVIGIMRTSNLLIDDLKRTLKQYPINSTEFSVLEFLYSKGEKNIQEITDELNFPNASYFGTFFKKQMGVSPQQYRRNINF